MLPAPTRQDTPELLDNPRSALPELAGNLRDIRQLNRWFGGSAIVLRNVRALLADHPAPARLLDVAAGSADIPLAAWRWAQQAGLDLEVVALDVSPEVLAEAQRVVGDAPVRLVQGDARSLPWPEESFDLVTCSLAIHHFSTEEAPCVLSEMWRVTRGSALVVDLTRSYPAYVGVWLATRMIARNRMTRHDGPLSVLRAYTKDELHRLAVGAGWKNLSLQRHAFFRQTLLGRKSVPHVR